MLIQRRRRLASIALAAALGLVSKASGEMRLWNGAVDTSFFTASQWSPAGVPADADQLYITAGRAITPASSTIRMGNSGSLSVMGLSAGLGMTHPVNSWPAPNVVVGSAGTGKLFVESGASLVTAAVDVGNANSSGEVVLRGAGSNWIVGVTHFRIGNEGTGSVKILDHAVLNYFATIDFGWATGSSGTLLVDDATVNVGSLTMSQGGSAFLTVQNGGIVNSSLTSVGPFSSSGGIVIVDGPNSILRNTSSHFVAGEYGNAQVTVSNGARIENRRNLMIGLNSLGRGVVTVTGPGSTIVSGEALWIGALDGSSAENAVLRVEAGGTLSAGTEILLRSSGRLSILATEQGAGRLSTPGTATLVGAFDFSLAPGFVPVAGTSWDIISAATVNGHFSSVTSSVPISVNYSATGVRVVFIPEPAGSLWTFPLVVAALRRGQRRLTVS